MKILILAVLILFIGLATEWIAAKLLISNMLLLFVITHMCGSLLLAISFNKFINIYYKKVEWSFYLFIFLNY